MVATALGCGSTREPDAADDGSSSAADGDADGSGPATGSSGGADDSTTGSDGPMIDFSAVDQRLESFVAEHPSFDGAAIVLVGAGRGPLHEAAFGSYTTDSVVMIASTSKMPAAMLLMALAEDASLDFDMDTTVDAYLPWESAWPPMTAAQMLSNTSGMPGLLQIEGYGVHMCQYIANGSLQLCGEAVYTTPLPDLVSHPPGTAWDYGGSQWQLAGAVAEVVGGASWAELVDSYLAGPCGLEVFAWGNMWSDLSAWTGDPADLVGQDNPNIEGGAITTIGDYAKLLQIHLDGGRCGDTQVLSPEGIAFMQIDRGTPAGSREFDFGAGSLGAGYGLGWWIEPRDESAPYLYYDPGAFGAVSWLDTDRGYAGFVAIADYTQVDNGDATAMILEDIIPLAEQAIDSGS